MKKFAFVMPDGSPVYTASPATDDMYTDGETYGGYVAHEIPIHVADHEALATWYWTPDGWAVRPTRVNIYDVWDEPSKSWKDGRSVDELKAAKHAQIEAARDARLTEPAIEYDGMNLDADPGAKQNLQDKVTAVASRIAQNTPTPQQMLVWKDRDNIIHTFEDLQTYKNWLDGYVIALENRGMQAWGWSWQMKDALNSMTTFEELLAFEVPPISP